MKLIRKKKNNTVCYWCWAPKGRSSVIYRKDWASAVSMQPVPARDESPEATHCSRPQSRSSIPKKLIPKLIMIGFFSPSLSSACSSEWCRERTTEDGAKGWICLTTHVREADLRTFRQLCKVNGVQLSLVQNVICLARFAQQHSHVTSS